MATYTDLYDLLQKENCITQFLNWAVRSYTEISESEEITYNVITDSLQEIVEWNRTNITISSEFTWTDTDDEKFWRTLHTNTCSSDTNAIDFYFVQLSSLDYLKLIVTADVFLKTLQSLMHTIDPRVFSLSAACAMDEINILTQPFKIITADGDEHTVRNSTTMDELLRHYQEVIQEI